MNVKLLELRDRHTFIPVMAAQLQGRDESERWLLRRAGYGAEQIAAVRSDGLEPYVILAKLDGVEAHYDSFEWTNQRTLGFAHRHIIEHWDTLKSGDVVDVEFLLGESPRPKESERVS